MKSTIFGILVGFVLVGMFAFLKTPSLTGAVSGDNSVQVVANGGQGAGEQSTAESLQAGQDTEQTASIDSADPDAVSIPEEGEGEQEVATAEEEVPSNPYHIIVNLPACRLRLYENDKLLKIYPVCVGRPGYRTPVRKMAISNIVWNPSWGPPQGSAWAAKSAARAPGKMNPMGVVKMPVHGYVFIHGTYKIKSLGFAWSHGCMRMANEDAVELAWFLQTQVGSNHPEHNVDYYMAEKRTSVVNLNSKVPVETIYDTIEIVDGRLLIYPDIYKQGTNTEAAVLNELKKAGWPTKNIDYRELHRLINRSRAETAIASREDLFGRSDQSAASAGQ